jgi:hypothetical protein
MITAIVSAIAQAPATTPPMPVHIFAAIPWWIEALAILGFLGLIAQAISEYQRRTDDPTWALKYQDMFESRNFIELRKLAIDVLQSRKDLSTRSKDLDNLDPVIDFFEDLGFYESGGQMSAEVIHHHFYHWIRGYLQLTEVYTRAWQKKEAARWEHLGELFEKLQEIEVESAEKYFPSSERFLDEEGIAEFFAWEIETW